MKKKELSYGFLLLVHMPRSLLLFLISRNILHAFIQNASRQQCPEYLLKSVIRREWPMKTLIIDAFFWDQTPEGYDFWYRRHLEYYKQL